MGNRVLRLLTLLCSSIILTVLCLFEGPIVNTLAMGEPVYYQDKVLVLMYHSIADAPNALSPELFASHLDALRDNGYHVIPMEDYVDFTRTGQPIPQNSVVITFDNGDASFYTAAYPELIKRGLPATNFLIIKSTDEQHVQNLPHLTWEQIREMKDHGMSFFSNTYDQHRLSKASANGELRSVLAHRLYLDDKGRGETKQEYRARIRSDLSLAETRLKEELGEQPHLLAYPYGDTGKTLNEVAREVGIELFFTTQEGINNRSNKQVYRLDAGAPHFTAAQLLAKMQRVVFHTQSEITK